MRAIFQHNLLTFELKNCSVFQCHLDLERLSDWLVNWSGESEIKLIVLTPSIYLVYKLEYCGGRKGVAREKYNISTK